MADDQEIFDEAVAANKPETPIETPQEAPVEEKAERERDDKGRFVSKAPEASDEVVQEPTPQLEAEKPEADAKVPSWRLAEEAQRRREAEQRYHELERQIRDLQMQSARQAQPQQQAPEPIDPFADPTGFANSIEQQFNQRLAAMQLEQSLRFSRLQNGETFDKAYEAFIDHTHRTRDQATYQRVMQSGDPGQALVDWYKQQELHKELGGSDLKSFLEKQREEWMKDPAVQAKVIEAFKASQQARPTNTVTSVPPSLSRATAAQSAHEDIDVRDGRGMYAYATAKR